MARPLSTGNGVTPQRRTKAVLKQYLRRNELAYLVAEVLYENALYVPLACREALSGLVRRLRTGLGRPQQDQTVMTWDVPFPGCEGPDDLLAWLRSRGVEVRKGGHTLYVPPQAALRDVIPSIVDFYPQNSGFKILKDFRDPLRARYIYLHPRSLTMLKKVVGAPRDQLPAANQIHALGIGPRVWDLCCWRGAGSENRYTVFVTEHVAGREPSDEQCRAFLARIRDLTSRGQVRILVPRWQHTEDFRPPDCNRNLLYSDELGRLQYVDFQNFGVAGDGARGRNAKAAFREQRHWASVCRTLRGAGVELDGRLILDLACGDGTRLHAALAAGAAWAIGWGSRDAIRAAGNRLLSRGCSRFHLVAADAGVARALEDAVPARLRRLMPQAVVFCSTRRGDLSSLERLRSMPWGAVVCEGDASDTEDEITRRIEPVTDANQIRVQRIATTRRAVDVPARPPVLVLTRQRVQPNRQHAQSCLEPLA